MRSSLLLASLLASPFLLGAGPGVERPIPAGSYLPFYPARAPLGKAQPEAPRKAVAVGAFRLDVRPVTNREYLAFVKANPEWRRSEIGRVFADGSYLKHWRADLSLRSRAEGDKPVTRVSWFAAAAYCRARGKELPTTDQWEYALDDGGHRAERMKDEILAWYSRPNDKVLEAVGRKPANGYGIQDLHALIWEWTLDFNSEMSGSEARSDGTKDENLFCGAGSLNARDPSDYAKFMRYQFRGSLHADYTTGNLGFRCAREETK
ncbi:MAG: formylglycine-generating enzyme family protein [Deltaproteobacteria bacterium]|nr:formylglycine-generating enzyme family protein [Deltaproteobacteria bacterium]